MIVQNNRLENNRWGLFMRFSDWVDLAGNTYQGNKEKDVVEKVTHLSTRPADPDNKPAPKARIEGPSRATVGEPVVFDASKSEDAAGRPLRYRWDIGDGKTGTEAKIEHVYQKPGFYRVGVTVNNGYLAGLAFRDFYVAKPVSENGHRGPGRPVELDHGQQSGQTQTHRRRNGDRRRQVAAHAGRPLRRRGRFGRVPEVEGRGVEPVGQEDAQLLGEVREPEQRLFPGPQSDRSPSRRQRHVQLHAGLRRRAAEPDERSPLQRGAAWLALRRASAGRQQRVAAAGADRRRPAPAPGRRHRVHHDQHARGGPGGVRAGVHRQGALPAPRSTAKCCIARPTARNGRS